MAEVQSIYPNGIDGYAQLPLVIDSITRIDAVTVNRLRSAIVNIEAELGVQPSALFDTVALRLDDLSSRLDAVELSVDEIENIQAALDVIQAELDSLAYKNPATVATTENVSNLSSGAPSIVDGVSLSVGDRILVFNQTTKSESGIYQVNSVGTGSDGIWSRTSDADTSSKLVPGTEIYIVEGDRYGTCKFWLVTPGPITLGTTSLDFIGGVKVMQSDATPTTVYTNTTMPTVNTNTTEMDIRNFREIEWFISIDDKLTAATVDSYIEFTDLESPTADDWARLQTEAISSGLATLSDYQAQKSLSAFSVGEVIKLGISSPVRGRMMRLVISSDAATGNVSVTAIRRI